MVGCSLVLVVVLAPANEPFHLLSVRCLATVTDGVISERDEVV